MPKYERTLIVTDTHGDLIDENWRSKVIAFADEFKPHHRVHLGDWSDACCLRNGASNEEKEADLIVDVDTGLEFLFQDFRATAVFDGNHDWRIDREVNNTCGGISRQLCREVKKKIEREFGRRPNVTHFPYCARRGVAEIGNSKLRAIHGFHECMHVAKKHAEIYNEVIFGHTHTFQYYTAAGHPRPKFGLGVGCGCGLDPEYARKSTNRLRWERGWAFMIANTETGEYKVWTCIEDESGNIWTPNGVI